MVFKLTILLGAFLGMEVVAHVVHKYVMHGFLWSLHRSHHQKGKSFFERNDLYFLLFATPGVILLFTGLNSGYDWKFFVGLGISLYGFTYLLVHDIIIHQRVRWLSKSNNIYVTALRKAHKAHHATTGKEADQSFGMLWVNRKYFNYPPGSTRRRVGQIRFFCEHEYPF